MRGNSVISVTAKKEIQTSLTLHRQQRQWLGAFAGFPKFKLWIIRGESSVSSNTLQDGVRELDKGSGAAGVKLLLAYRLMSSGLGWPKVDWRPPSRADLIGPPPPDGTRQHHYSTPPPPSPLRQNLHAVPQRLDRETQTQSRQFKWSSIISTARECIGAVGGMMGHLEAARGDCVRFH